MEMLDRLRKVKIFSNLKDEETHDLLNNLLIIKYQKSDVIQREQSYIRAIPVILSGVIKVILIDSKDAKEVFLYYITEGSTSATTISQGLFRDTLNLRIEAETDCEIGYIPIEYFNKLLSKHPEIFQKLLEIYFNIFLDLINSMSNHVFNSIEEKVFFLLHYKSKVLKTKEIEITHEQLAKELNTSREVITRALHELSQKNILKFERKKIKLSEVFFNKTTAY